MEYEQNSESMQNIARRNGKEVRERRKEKGKKKREKGYRINIVCFKSIIEINKLIVL